MHLVIFSCERLRDSLTRQVFGLKDFEKASLAEKVPQTLHSNEFKEFVFICELSFLILSEKLFSANLFTRISLTRLLF